jgi:hypothetical protein
MTGVESLSVPFVALQKNLWRVLVRPCRNSPLKTGICFFPVAGFALSEMPVEHEPSLQAPV